MPPVMLSGARAAVGFEHVAIDGDRPLADGRQVDHRPQAAADQPLDFRRAAVDVAAAIAPLPGLVLPGSMLYSAVTQPRPLPFIQGGTSPRRGA